MAEFILKDMLVKRGINGVSVCSRATSDEEVGNPVYPLAREELAKHGIPSDGKYAVQLKKSDYNNADLFICMDESNVRNANRIFGGDKDGKVVKLLKFCGCDDDIADPWYTRRFALTYEQIEKGCAALLDNFYRKK